MEPTIQLTLTRHAEIFDRLKELEEKAKDYQKRIEELERLVYILERTKVDYEY